VVGADAVGDRRRGSLDLLEGAGVRPTRRHALGLGAAPVEDVYAELDTAADDGLDVIPGAAPIDPRSDEARLGADEASQVGEAGTGVLELAPPRMPTGVALERHQQRAHQLDVVEAPGRGRADGLKLA